MARTLVAVEAGRGSGRARLAGLILDVPYLSVILKVARNKLRNDPLTAALRETLAQESNSVRPAANWHARKSVFMAPASHRDVFRARGRSHNSTETTMQPRKLKSG